MKDEEGFDITLVNDPGTKNYWIRVTKTVKFSQTEIVPLQVIDDDELLAMVISRLKSLVRETLNGITEESSREKRT